MSSNLMKRFYEVNDAFPIYRLGEAPTVPEGRAWNGGGRLRRMLQCIYNIAFLCLLRFDEVLKIQAHHLEVVSWEEIKLTLPFRKTHKYGGT